MTTAKPVNRVKWRYLHVRLRNFFIYGPPEDNVCDKLEHFKNAFHRADLSIFGGKTNKTADWFESLSEKTPVADEKTSALSAYKACLSAVEALLGTTIVCDQV